MDCFWARAAHSKQLAWFYNTNHWSISVGIDIVVTPGFRGCREPLHVYFIVKKLFILYVFNWIIFEIFALPIYCFTSKCHSHAPCLSNGYKKSHDTWFFYQPYFEIKQEQILQTDGHFEALRLDTWNYDSDLILFLILFFNRSFS